jgi:hypothetical protein
MIHQAEFKKRVESVTDKKVEPTERRRQRTINLNINNFKVSFRSVGEHLVRSERKQAYYPSLNSLGQELADLDASRSLMKKLDEIAARGKDTRRHPDAIITKQPVQMTTMTSFYDAKSGKLMQLRDL